MRPSIRDLVGADLRSGLALLVVCVLMQAAPAWAQAQEPPKSLRLYLDCRECDTEFLRQNLLFVDYVRDRLAADIHVFVTTQSTGSGGTSWTMKLIGAGRFQGLDRTSVFTTPQNFTSDERRREFARRLRLALAGYATCKTFSAPYLPSIASSSSAIVPNAIAVTVPPNALA
jgi:hypothetical protein